VGEGGELLHLGGVPVHGWAGRGERRGDAPEQDAALPHDDVDQASQDGRGDGGGVQVLDGFGDRLGGLLNLGSNHSERCRGMILLQWSAGPTAHGR
jgi:hypothetical protein